MAPLQTVLTQLHIRHVFLYPRFHESVNADLAKKKSDVLTLHQPLSDSMDKIQTAIIECMDATLAELKRSNANIEVEDLTVENALFRSFDAIIKTQLNPQWHRISPKTRGLVYDLTTLRSLLSYLLSFDAVSFNQYLETILASSTHNARTGTRLQNPSPWLDLPVADTIFQTARDRVYRKVAVQADKEESAPPAKKVPTPQAQREQTEDAYWEEGNDSIFDDPALLAATQSASTAGTSQSQAVEEDTVAEMFRPVSANGSNGKGKERAPNQDLPGDFYNSRNLRTQEQWAHLCPKGSQPVLEEQPKWYLLREILAEIENELHWKPVDFDDPSNDTILIMCESSRTVATLRRYLSSIPDLDRDEDGNESAYAAKGGGHDMMTARASEYFLWKGSLGKINKNITAAGQTNIRNLGEAPRPGATTAANGATVEYESAAMKRKSLYKHGQVANKRRRQRGGASSSAGDRSSTKNKSGAGTSASVLEAEAEEIASSMAESTLDGTDGILSNSLQDQDEDFDPVAFNEYFGLCEPEQTIVIRAYSGDEDDKILQELRPRFIILYDPSTSYVRRIEVHIRLRLQEVTLISCTGISSCVSWPQGQHLLLRIQQFCGRAKVPQSDTQRKRSFREAYSGALSMSVQVTLIRSS